jgi:hypothetical protein
MQPIPFLDLAAKETGRPTISIEGEVVISVLRGISEGARSLPEIALIVTAERAGGA